MFEPSTAYNGYPLAVIISGLIIVYVLGILILLWIWNCFIGKFFCGFSSESICQNVVFECVRTRLVGVCSSWACFHSNVQYCCQRGHNPETTLPISCADCLPQCECNFYMPSCRTINCCCLRMTCNS